MRTIPQPGPPIPARITSVPCTATPLDLTLPAGLTLLDALAALLTDGMESACLTLEGGALHPFAYVIPSLPPDPSHAAYYSETRRPAAPCALTAAALTLGWRDHRPFFHCHALWTNPDGTQGCGHVLPAETTIAAPIRAHGIGLTGARFDVRPDPETGFSLFTPHPTRNVGGVLPALALRIAPGQDLVHALESAARTAGFPEATLHGGVASTIEARFTPPGPKLAYATELLVRHGHIHPGATSRVDIAIVDLHGAIAHGRLVPGDNPILMTFEGALTPR